MPTLTEQRDALLEKANAVIATAKADHDRLLTDPPVTMRLRRGQTR